MTTHIPANQVADSRASIIHARQLVVMPSIWWSCQLVRY